MIPLAERLRPKSLDEYIGQTHLLGQNSILRRMIDSGRIPSIILWGPPGVGKTTLANIIAKSIDTQFYSLNAVSSGVKDVRDIIENVQKNKFFDAKTPILFIDEIHRFSKSQQDSLLNAVEKGILTLIGATTENPSFEIIRPLLSRCQLYTLEPLEEKNLLELTNKAIESESKRLQKNIILDETNALFRYSGGDARKLLNILDLILISDNNNDIIIDDKNVTEKIQANPAAYDKDSEMHYDIISAFIKSMRGSNPDASLYWLARMIEGGEDPKFISRRLVIFAAEDVGLANPNALLIANACFDSLAKIGWPEGRIILSEATIYLACSPKSNSAYYAIDEALQFVRNSKDYPVPLHLRNAPTKLMKDLNYGKGYLYPHNYENNYVEQSYLPTELKNISFWKPGLNQAEKKHEEHLFKLKNKK